MVGSQTSPVTPSPTAFRNLTDYRANVALIDIEGTVGSIAFVRDVLFPFARERMAAYVESNQHDPKIRAILDDAAREAGVDATDIPAIIGALHDWSDRDVKVTPLKQLQGNIWVAGYAEADGIRGHLYPDAIEALRRFHAAGIALYIYSSGSVPAQKLLFGNSVAGDLTPLLCGYYDTTIGGKRDASSYTFIVKDIGCAPGDAIFFSDNEAELDAAHEAGVQTVQLARPEDGTVATAAHPSVGSFEDVVLIHKAANSP